MTIRWVTGCAAELEVDALVEGSVMRSGDRVRVAAQMIDGPTDQHLWAGTFDRSTGDLLTLVSDVAEAIGNEVHLASTPELRARRPNLQPSSLEAEDTFFRARYFLSLGTRAGLTESKELFARVIELDADFAPAFAGVGTASFLQGIFGHIPHRQAAAECEQANQRALELDPDLPEALGGLGMTRLYYDWDWPAAGRGLARAIDISPNNALIRHGYGDYLLVMGRLEESLEQIKLGRQYDPASPLAVVPVVAHLTFVGRYKEAVREAE